MQIKTPAKITPHLRILAKRGDGFHEVRIALVAVSLFDELNISPRTGGGVRLRVDGPDDLGPPEQNLVYRAALAFAEAAGVAADLDIVLTKHIPAGAGLGGGSGNAAGTLIALNALHGEPLPPRRLFELALALGSDVPFFLSPAPALAEGRGERLTPLPPPPGLHLILLKPPFSISTAAAYGCCRPTGTAGAPPELQTLPGLLRALRNDFEPALFTLHPELAVLKARLLESGAEGALLSGSGSALFGVFRGHAPRERAAAELRGEPHLRVFCCETLAGHSYLPEDLQGC